MLLLLILVLVSLGTTYGFTFLFNYPSGMAGALLYLLTLILSIIVVAILLFLFFIFSFYIAKERNPKGMFKHHLMTCYSRLIYGIFMRVKLIVRGKENIPKHSNFVIYANHIEYCDPVYMKMAFHNHPVAFISKESLFKHKLVKMVLGGIGCIPISPGADRSALNSIVAGIKIVKNGQPLAIFPEGTRSYSHNLLPFKAGSFKLATKAKAEIIPVCLYNMHEVLRKGRWKVARVILTVLPAIKPEDYEHMDTSEISDKVFVTIDECLRSIEEKQK